jgi:hypothetical protein
MQTDVSAGWPSKPEFCPRSGAFVPEPTLRLPFTWAKPAHVVSLLVVLFKFKGEEVDPARIVAGNELAIAAERATRRGRIAGEGRHNRSRS